MKRVGALLLLLVSLGAVAATEHTQHEAHSKLALAVSATFDSAGRLWRVSKEGGHVVVSHSDDRGHRFSAPVRVNETPEKIAADGDNRPKIAIARDGTIYVSYTALLPQPYSGHVRLSRSSDAGQSFTPPITVNSDQAAISHRFESLAVDSQGRARLVWIDKRDQAAAKALGKGYAGAALYTATSDERAVGANQKLVDHSCECCRVAMALDTDGVPVIAWRHVFGQNIRDHALQRLDGKSPLIRVAQDQWAIDACPHHGPALAIGADGTYHVAWFTNGEKRKGLFYARSSDHKTFSEPLAFGDPSAQAGHPTLLSLGANVYLAWKEFDGAKSTIRVMHSIDAGAHWSAPVSIADSTGASDYPLLINDGAHAYVSWNTQQEGYRLIAVPAAGERR